MPTQSAPAGFLLAATGERFISEAEPLIASIRRYMPDAPVHLVSNSETSVEDGLFDSIDRFELDPVDVPLKHTGFLFRDVALNRTPFELTIHLDCDTILGAPVHEMFHALRRFDLLVGAAPTRVLDFGASAANLPDSGKGPLPIVPRINAGVMAYSKKAVEDGFFRHWVDLYLSGAVAAIKAERHNYSDQSMLRRAIWETGINYQMMTPEYHLRAGRSCVLDGPVRILHGRPRHGREQVIGTLNADTGHRIYLPNIGVLKQNEGAWNVTSLSQSDNQQHEVLTALAASAA